MNMEEESGLFVNQFAQQQQQKTNKYLLCYRITILVMLMLILAVSALNTSFSIKFYQKSEKIQSDLDDMFGNNKTEIVGMIDQAKYLLNYICTEMIDCSGEKMKDEPSNLMKQWINSQNSV